MLASYGPYLNGFHLASHNNFPAWRLNRSKTKELVGLLRARPGRQILQRAQNELKLKGLVGLLRAPGAMTSHQITTFLRQALETEPPDEPTGHRLKTACLT